VIMSTCSVTDLASTTTITLFSDVGAYMIE